MVQQKVEKDIKTQCIQIKVLSNKIECDHPSWQIPAYRIFKLATMPNKVEFVFLGPKLAQMGFARVARRQMVRLEQNTSASKSSFIQNHFHHKSNCESVAGLRNTAYARLSGFNRPSRGASPAEGGRSST